jgi:hypothetical protein
MTVRFDGFQQGDVASLTQAFQAMQRASAKAKRDLMGGKLNAYRKWFDGTGKNAHLMKVASIVNEIDQAITSRGITFANAEGNSRDKKGLCGYVWLVRTQQGVVHFGSGMRVLLVPRTHGGSIKDLAETMYHELSHKVGSTKDITYNAGQCEQNAKTNPLNASTNAENFNLFLREYL